MKDPAKDLLLAFGVVMGIASAWQYLEGIKAQTKTSNEHKELLRRLKSIEDILKKT